MLNFKGHTELTLTGFPPCRGKLEQGRKTGKRSRGMKGLTSF